MALAEWLTIASENGYDLSMVGVPDKMSVNNDKRKAATVDFWEIAGGVSLADAGGRVWEVRTGDGQVGGRMLGRWLEVIIGSIQWQLVL